MSGIIYVLTNPAMEGYVKVGRTNNLIRRIKELDNTSTPLPFECVFAVEVDNPEEVELRLHDAFADGRTRSTRESQFKLDMLTAKRRQGCSKQFLLMGATNFIHLRLGKSLVFFVIIAHALVSRVVT